MHGSPGALRERQIDRRRRRSLEVAVKCIGRYAHNLDVALWACLPRAQALAERTPIAETAFGERLIHNRTHGRAGPISFVDRAAGQDGNLHRGKEVGPNRQDAATLKLAVVSIGARYADTCHARAGSDESMIGKACRAHTRNRGDLRPKAAIKSDNLRVGVSGLPGVYLEGQHVFPAESELNRR